MFSVSLSTKKQRLQIFSIWLMVIVSSPALGGSKLFPSTLALRHSHAVEAGNLLTQEWLLIALHFYPGLSQWFSDIQSYLLGNTGSCQQTLFVGEYLNEAIASMPEDCELLLYPGSVLANDSIIMKKGQSIRVSTNQGVYKRLRSNYMVEYSDQGYQLIAVEPKQWQTISGEGRVQIIAGESSQPLFIVAGPYVRIDPHLIFPPLKSDNGHTGITFSDIQWFETLEAAPEVSLSTKLPEKNVTIAHSSDKTLVTKRPESDSDTAKGGQVDQKSKTLSPSPKKTASSHKKTTKKGGASGDGGGKKPPRESSYTKPLPQDAVDTGTLLDALLDYLRYQLGDTSDEKVQALSRRLQKLLARITSSSSDPEQWQQRFYTSMITSLPLLGSLSEFNSEMIVTIINDWAAQVALQPVMDDNLTDFIHALFQGIESPDLSHMLPSEVLEGVRQKQTLSLPRKFGRKQEAKSSTYRGGYQTDTGMKNKRSYSKLSLSTLAMQHTGGALTIDEARLHLLAAIRSFLTKSTNYPSNLLGELLKRMNLTKSEKEALARSICGKCQSIPGASLDHNLLSYLVTFMERKRMNNHRRSDLVEWILAIVSPRRAVAIAKNILAAGKRQAPK